MSDTIRCRFLFALFCALFVCAMSVKAAPPPLTKALVADPIGDAVNGPDIKSFSADIVGNTLVLAIETVGTFSLPHSGASDELFAAIVIETDGAASAVPDGAERFCTSFTAGFTPEMLILLGRDSPSVSSPLVLVAGNPDQVLGTASATFSSRSVTVSVPLATIRAGSAPTLVAAGVAFEGGVDNIVASDCAPDTTPLTAQTVAVGPPVQVAGSAQAGATRNFRAPVAAPRYDWDLDGDGVIDRSGTRDTLDVTYPSAYAGNVTVLASASNGARTASTLAISTAAPLLAVSGNGASTQLCGDGDARPEPGETWSVPVRIANQGTVATSGGAALFAAKDRLDAASAGQSIDGKLEIANPLVDVGNLAPGEAATANVTVSLARDTVCNASYALLFSGGVDAASASPGQQTPVATFTLPAEAECQVYTGGCSATPGTKATVTPRQGLYYNPNRSGNGLSNFIIPVAGASPVYFGAWFTGAADHLPTWYVIQGPLAGNVVVAPIYRFTRDVASSTFKTNSSIVGQAVVTMKSSERMALLWQIGGKVGIELMDYFVAGPAPTPNRTGAWYNPAESGWGQVIHAFVSGGTNYVFAVDYLYDGAGEPRWVLGQGTDAQLVAGASHQTYRVHCPGCPWIADWNENPIGSGTATEVFLDATHGRTSTSFDFPTPLAGSWRRTDLPIELLTPPQ